MRSTRGPSGAGTAATFGAGATAFCAVLAFAGVARAGEVPRWSELPSGHVTTMPTAKKPAFIAAREQVPGIFVAAAKFAEQTPARARHVSVVGDAKTAEQIRKGEGVDSDEREGGACFSDSSDSRGDEEDGDTHEWTAGQMWQVNLWPKSKENESAGVGAVHREQIVYTKGTASLESVDAWVDPSTHGVRLIGRASLPLVQVGSAVGGVKIYAARDERLGGVTYLQYVVVRPVTPSTARLGTMMAMRQDGVSAHGSGCGHLRMPLVVEKNDGDTAVVIAPVELPAFPKAKGEEGPGSADAKDGEDAKDAKDAPVKAEDAPVKAEDAPVKAEDAPVKADVPPHGVAKPKGKRRFGKRGLPPAPAPPPSLAVSLAAAGEAPKVVEPVEREARTRDMQVHLGVSQTSRDKEPLLAVSFGWASREQVQRVFDEPKR